MTSPVGGKPESTQDRYDDVHSIGSSFGAELDENAVRKLLGNQVENPFGSIVTGLAGTVVGILESVANGILGIFKPGNKEEPIRNAIVAVMEPMKSQIFDLGANLTALSDETKLRIDEQKGLIDDATAAVNEAKDAVAAVKAIADQNKLAITEAISKAEKASADLAALAPQITAAINAANKASSDVSTLTPKVTAAKEEAAKASQDIAALSPKVTDAVSKSEKATSDVAALTPKVTAASNKATQAANDVADLTPKVTAVQEKANKAASDLTTLTPKVTAAQKRADAAYTEAGKVRTDLTPKITAAQTKADTAVADLTKLEPKVTAAQSKADSAYTEAGKVRSEVTPKIEAAQTKGESALAVADTAIDWLSNPVDIGTSLLANVPGTETPAWIGSEGVYEIPKEELPAGAYNGWYSDNTDIQALPKLKVSVNPGFEYKVSGWAKREAIESEDASAFLLHIRSDEDSNPIDVYDRKKGPGTWWSKNPYILSYRTIATEWEPFEISVTFKEHVSKVWISAVTWSFTSSSHIQAKNYVAGLRIEPVIPTQASVDQAQNDAIRANAEILRQQEEINAAQATANLAQKNFNDNQQKWNTASSNATKALQDSAALQGLLNDAQADINAHQKIFNDNQTKWNTASTNATKALADAAKAQTAINAEQTKFNNFQTQFNKDQIAWNKASTNATKALQDSSSALSKIATEQSKLNALQSDFNTKQTKWNAAVDRSIATQKTVNDNFSKWTTGATTAIEANTTAIKALSKIDTGESLIAYLTPTDAEVKAGTAKYDVPVWTTGAHREFSGQNPPPKPVKYAYGASSTDVAKSPKTVPVAVRPGTKYILSFWAYGSGNMVIYMYGNAGYPIRSTRQLKVNQETLQIEKDSGGKRIYDPARNGNSSSSTGTQWLLNGFAPDELHKWVHYKFEVEFTGPTTEVRFDRFYWNWRETSVDGQYLGDMQFYPDVPTQADVDEAQNKAIEATSEFAKQQVELNTLFQEQLWSQLDMIEQGEIQRTRVYHQWVTDGSLTSNIPSWVGWSSAREYKNTFINFYHRHADTKKIYWQATGSWEGVVKVTMTWDNGAIDTWVYTVHKDRITRGSRTYMGRTMSNAGGAAFINHRNTTFEVYPKNLGRQAAVFISSKDDGTGTRWVDEDAPSINQPSMIRYKSEDMCRLTASVTSDKEVTTRVYQDGEWVKKVYAPDTVIPPSMIWRKDVPQGITYFMETNFLGVDW